MPAWAKHKIRDIQPLGPRLVRVIKEDDRHESGLYLPAGSREVHQEAFYGEVMEVARATTNLDVVEDKSFGTNVSGVPCGARVLFRKDAGIRVPWDESLRVLDVKDVLATVEEVEPEAIQ